MAQWVVIINLIPLFIKQNALHRKGKDNGPDDWKDGNLWKKFCKDKKNWKQKWKANAKKCFGKLKNENDRLFEK